MANIEFSKVITPTTDTTLYGHQAYDQAGFPMNAGNFKLSTIMGMFLSTQDDEIKGHFEFVEGLDRNYTLNYKGVAVANLRLPPDRFLKEARFNQKSKILTLTFATDTVDQLVDIDFSSLIDVYTAGNGLQIQDATFSLKLQAGEARLKVSEAGLSLDLSDVTKMISDESTTRLNADNAIILRVKALEDSWATNLETIKKASEAAVNAATQTGVDAKNATEAANAATGAANRSSVHEANALAAKTRALEWAVKMDLPVEGSEYSAKHHATNAKQSAENAKTSEDNALQSAKNAKISEDTALQYKNEMDPAKYPLRTDLENTNKKLQETSDGLSKAQEDIAAAQRDISNIAQVNDGYIKFDNGFLLCWGVIEVKAEEAEHAGYYGVNTLFLKRYRKETLFPIPFISIPTYSLTGQYRYWTGPVASINCTNQGLSDLFFITDNPNLTGSNSYFYIAVGLWK